MVNKQPCSPVPELSPFFPPHIGAEPGRAKRESSITCMRMLKTNQSKITRPWSIPALVNVSRNTFYSSRAEKEKKTFSLVLILWKKTNWYVFYRGLYSYRQRLSVITLFPSIFFVLLFLHFERVCKRLAWHCWNSTDLGLCFIWNVFLPLRMQKLLLVYYYSENRATSGIWNVLPNMVFSPIWGGKMAKFWTCACKLDWTLLSPARVQPLYGAGRRESSGTGLTAMRLLIFQVLRCVTIVWSQFWTFSKCLLALETIANNQELRRGLYRPQNVNFAELFNFIGLVELQEYIYSIL